MKIYVVIKSGLQEFGEFCIASTEAAFTTKEKAEEYIKKLPIVWSEKVNGINFLCERAVHDVDLNGE